MCYDGSEVRGIRECLVSRRKPAPLGTTLSCERKMVTLESVGNWVGADTELVR